MYMKDVTHLSFLQPELFRTKSSTCHNQNSHRFRTDIRWDGQRKTRSLQINNAVYIYNVNIIACIFVSQAYNYVTLLRMKLML